MASLISLLLVVRAAFQVAGPRVVRRFIDEAVGGAPENVLYHTAVLFISVSAGAQVLRVLAAYWSEQVAWMAMNALRLDLTAHLLNLDAGFHKTRTPGELIERVDGDVNDLAGFLSSFAGQVLGSTCLLLGILASLFIENLVLGVAFALFSAGAVIVLGRVRRLAGPALRETREREALFDGFLGEVLTATEDIRSSGAVPYVRNRLIEHLRGWLPAAVRAEVWGNFVWAAALVVLAFGDALAYGLGGLIYHLGMAPIGTVYMVLAYVALLAQPLETIRTQLQSLQQADAGITRIRQLLTFRSPIVDGTAAIPAGALTVEFRDVCFAYDEEQERVLDRISFTLGAGRRLGVLGRTGSGKTTLARLLFRMYDPQAGGVILGGVPLTTARLASVRSRVGLVTQEVQLFQASLRDNLTFFDPRVPDSRLIEVLVELGLGPWFRRQAAGLDAPVSAASLSGGEAQLLALARAFLQDPGLVIIDEASSRLDPVTEGLLGGAIERLFDGRTAVIIAHRLATLETIDDLLILDDGRIVEHGAKGELAADPASHLNRLCRDGLREALDG